MRRLAFSCVALCAVQKSLSGSSSDVLTAFSTDFETEAKDGRLWIRPSWGGAESNTELVIQGVSWGGFEHDNGCPVGYGEVNTYLNFLEANGPTGTGTFNAVRFLSLIHI